MSKINYVQSNVGAGELSPQVEGRVDIAKYANGVKLLENMYVKSYGGASKYPGSYYIAEVKDSSKDTILVKFEFSVTQAYVIEFGDLYIRFYKDGGQILDPVNPVEVATPYLEADLYELQFAQSADTLYIVHKDYAPRKLTRTSHTAWTLTALDFTWGPFLAANTTATTLNPDGVAGSINVVASANVFDAGHVGAQFKIVNGATTGYVVITAVTDAQNAVATVVQTIAAGAVTTWSEGAWSDYRGYPGSVTFFEQRLWFGGSTHRPQTLWASQTDDYENMKTGASDSDALDYTISDNMVNVVSWLLPVRSLAVGTVGGPFILSTSDGGPVTPSNVAIRKEMSYRCAQLPPVRIGANIYYLQNNLRTMREIFYDYTYDTFTGNDVTLLAEHITESGIIQMDIQESPDNILWCVRSDGEMAIMTRQIEQQVIAWSRIITDGLFKSVAIIPDGEEDAVYVIVERTIGGATKKYIEYFKPIDFGSDQEDCFFIHSGLTYNSYADVLAGVTAALVEGATRANPVVITSTAHPFVDGDIIKIRNVVGMTEINDIKFVVDNAGVNDFELNDAAAATIDGTLYGTYVSGGEIRKCSTTFTGALHLAGKTVKVLADGMVHPDAIVDVAGEFTLDGYYSEVHAGLGYTAKLQTMRLETGSMIGPAQGILKRIYYTTIRLFKSLGVRIGTSSGIKDTVPFRTTSMALSEPVPLFTGDKKIEFPSDWNTEGQVYIESDDPLPLNILLLASKIETANE